LGELSLFLNCHFAIFLCSSYLKEKAISLPETSDDGMHLEYGIAAGIAMGASD